jgi:hypothetical protein
MRMNARVFEHPRPANLPTDLDALLWQLELYLALTTMSVAVLLSFHSWL